MYSERLRERQMFTENCRNDPVNRYNPQHNSRREKDGEGKNGEILGKECRAIWTLHSYKVSDLQQEEEGREVL